MAGLTNFVTTLEKRDGDALRELLLDAGFELREAPHAVFGAKGEGVSVVYYESGKLVVQGKGASDFKLQRLSAITGPAAPRLTRETIGADEAGKGDWFGPLCVAACALTPEVEAFLDEVPLEDSKKLSDGRIRQAADHLRQVLAHEVIVIGPKRYNEMYASFGNLNRLLAWAHAKAILGVVDKTGCRNVLLDRFCDQSVVEKALGARAQDVDLTSRPRAEEDPAVAAASLLARDGFVRALERLGKTVGFELPKGAGAPVLAAGKALVRAKGRDILGEVSKLHFKTTEDVLASV